jgi:hypothetical protein
MRLFAIEFEFEGDCADPEYFVEGSGGEPVSGTEKAESVDGYEFV